jgi:hypothetical protein
LLAGCVKTAPGKQRKAIIGKDQFASSFLKCLLFLVAVWRDQYVFHRDQDAASNLLTNFIWLIIKQCRFAIVSLLPTSDQRFLSAETISKSGRSLEAGEFGYSNFDDFRRNLNLLPL